MNYSIIGYVLRYILCSEGLLLLLPSLVALIYKEQAGFAFMITAALCILIASPFTLKKPKAATLRVKEGFVAVALGWIVLSVMGALPFVISGAIPDPVDALFEIVSGFTTTGASILTDIEVLPKCVLFWRSFSHWIGGMGVLVFILTVLPMSGGSHMNLMKAESPGPSVDKLVPKVQTTAKILYGIYIFLTVLMVAFLLFAKMPVFDALTTAFGTAGTGGFSIKNDSMAGYSNIIQTIVTVFMILFGVNFNFYFLLLSGRHKKAIQSEEVLTYLSIILIAIGIVSFDIYSMYNNAAEAVHQAAFQVGSIITTTGFSTTDFNLWPSLSKTILVTLMFIGACAGSTGGGVKVSRFIIAFKSIGKEIHSFIHPNGVKRITFDKKQVSHEVVRSTNVFLGAYIFIFIVSLIAITFDGKDLVTNFTAIAATFNNIGPGLEVVGPASNFSSFSHFSKLVLIFDMLAGRLELFPMLLLFNRHTWKRF